LIIPAAGFGFRWGFYWKERKDDEARGWHKHLAEINGEAIIHRLVRLFQEAGVEDIWVLSRYPELYTINGTTHYEPAVTPENGDADKFINSIPLWTQDDRTVLVYGDVYITPEAVATIVTDDTPLSIYGNTEQHDGCWGISFQPEQQDHLAKYVDLITFWKRRGLVERNGTWELAHALANNGQIPTEEIRIHHGIWVEIADLTRDIDTPAQYEELKALVESA
jgi:hypothetical protein